MPADPEVRNHPPGTCRAREVLDRVGDKWSVYVIALLGNGTKRFSELRREIEAITPRMLTVTLRTLERDGLVSRKVYPVVPPRVDYTLTPMGATLLDTVSALIQWADVHLAEIDAARAAYDADHGGGDPGNGDPTRVDALPASDGSRERRGARARPPSPEPVSGTGTGSSVR